MAVKAISATIDEELYKKAKKLIKITQDLNMSKVLNLGLQALLEDEDNNYGKLINEIGNSILIPVDKYTRVFGLKGKTVRVQISQGLIDSINLGGKTYIKMEDDDLRNIFYQIIELKERVAKLEEK